MKRDDLNSATATCMACGRTARVSVEHDAHGASVRIRKNCGCAGGVDVRVGEPLATSATPARSLKREVVR